MLGQIEAGLFDVNGPTAVSPVLITGNSRLMQQVLLSVLSTTTSPMWMLSVDTGGHTVDMSLVYRTLTPEAIANAIQSGDPSADNFARRIILPGLAETLTGPVADLVGCPVEVGPICAAELPLFFGSEWVR
jgi:CO dehydrogenase/acetyl-CoA synthase gamma subunit (corrinoid Fe-S protein)